MYIPGSKIYIHWYSAALSTIEILLLLLFVFFYWSNPYNERNKRFLRLILVILVFNLITGILPFPESVGSAFDIQIAISYLTGIFVFFYVIYYIYKEFDLEAPKHFDLKSLLIIVLPSFFLLYIIPMLIWRDRALARNLFVGLMGMWFIYFCYKINAQLRSHSFERDVQGNFTLSIQLKRFQVRCVLILLLVIIVINITGLDEIYETLGVNAAFLVLSLTYLFEYLLEERKLHNEYIILTTKYNQYDESLKTNGLTAREREVAFMLIEGKTYKEIADKISLQPNTIGRHASTIYKKMGVRNKSELMHKFADCTVL